jgi:glycosyltransferase involved in cell wall biosynthesis
MRVAFWLVQDSLHQVNRWVAGFYYVRHCLTAMAKLPRDEIPAAVAFVPESLTQDLVDPEVGPTPWLKTVRIADKLLGAPTGRHELARIAEGYPCDVSFPWVTSPMSPIDGHLVGWIPDYQHRRHPEFFSVEERIFRDALFQLLIGICDRIVCSSEAVRSDLRTFYPESEGRDRVLRFTAQPPRSAFDGDPCAVTRRLGITGPYFYLPNQFWIHKNHRVVFEAWRKLCKRGRSYTLVCSGATDDYRAPGHFETLKRFLARHGLEDSVRILGMVDRDDQWQLYRGAKAVLQPSLFEGWSTSVEEAKSLGKPVILSDIATHCEQMGDAGVYFAKDDACSLAETVDRVWNELPEGLDAGQEAAAYEASGQRVYEFGRNLVQLLAETVASPARRVAPLVLPMLLHMQDECRKRLEVIEELRKAADERLELVHSVNKAAEERLRVIHTLDRACQQRSVQIARLEQQLRARA